MTEIDHEGLPDRKMDLETSCPFCGDGKGYLVGPTPLGRWWVRCNSCAATGPWAKTDTAATRMWNGRWP